MIPRVADLLDMGWGHVWLLVSNSKMKGPAGTLRDPGNVAVKECQPCVHFQSIKN